MTKKENTTGYDHALQLLRECSTPDGFLASTTDRDNYRRVWSRDGMIVSLAALLTEEKDLQKTVLATLRTLMHHQGPHGEIPSNVDPHSGRVSYGGMAGRVDGNLWFLIGCASYFRATRDEHFLEEFFPAMEKIVFLLGAWEFNSRGLLYIPQTGDWSDEYVQHGYVLYDQALYYRALKDFSDMEQVVRGRKEPQMGEKIDQLRELIRTNYWFMECSIEDPGAYHPVLHRKGCLAAEHRNQHWMAFFSPAGYGYRFDAFANILTSILGIADRDQSDTVDAFIAKEVQNKDMMLLPAFHPVITPQDDAWNHLQVSFSYTFKNNPYEFHNGGLWPLVTGFYVVDLLKRQKEDLAKQYLAGIHQANAMDAENGSWGFYEFLHGKNLTPGGTRHQCWSAAAAVIAEYAMKGEFVL